MVRTPPSHYRLYKYAKDRKGRPPKQSSAKKYSAALRNLCWRGALERQPELDPCNVCGSPVEAVLMYARGWAGAWLVRCKPKRRKRNKEGNDSGDKTSGDNHSSEGSSDGAREKHQVHVRWPDQDGPPDDLLMEIEALRDEEEAQKKKKKHQRNPATATEQAIQRQIEQDAALAKRLDEEERAAAPVPAASASAIAQAPFTNAGNRDSQGQSSKPSKGKGKRATTIARNRGVHAASSNQKGKPKGGTGIVGNRILRSASSSKTKGCGKAPASPQQLDRATDEDDCIVISSDDDSDDYIATSLTLGNDDDDDDDEYAHVDDQAFAAPDEDEDVFDDEHADDAEDADDDEDAADDDEDAAAVVAKLERTPSVADSGNDAEEMDAAGPDVEYAQPLNLDAEDLRIRDEEEEDFANTPEEPEHEDEDPEEYRVRQAHGLWRSEYELHLKRRNLYSLFIDEKPEFQELMEDQGWESYVLFLWTESCVTPHALRVRLSNPLELKLEDVRCCSMYARGAYSSYEAWDYTNERWSPVEDGRIRVDRSFPAIALRNSTALVCADLGKVLSAVRAVAVANPLERERYELEAFAEERRIVRRVRTCDRVNIVHWTVDGRSTDIRAIDRWERDLDLRRLARPWETNERISYEIWDVAKSKWVLTPGTNSAKIAWPTHTLLMRQPGIQVMPWFDLELQALAFPSRL